MAKHSPALSPLWELTKMRLREFMREKAVVFWVFLFPMFMALALGMAFRSRPPERPRIVMVTSVRDRLVQALLESPQLHVEIKGEAAAQRDLARAKADILVRMTADGPLYLYDHAQDRALLAKMTLDQALQQAAGRRDAIAVREVLQSLPGTRYIDFLIPGLIGTSVMGTSIWGVGYNLVLARKRRQLRRFAVTPMNRAQFLLSYFFSRCVFLILEIAVLVLYGHLLFDSIVQGGYATLGIVGFFGAASFAGISLLVGARVENTESANGWMNLVQFPMWVFSGAFFSYERFPERIHGLIRLLPLTALNDALRAVFNDGASLVDCGSQLLVLAAWGGVGFTVALRTFRWQ